MRNSKCELFALLLAPTPSAASFLPSPTSLHPTGWILLPLTCAATPGRRAELFSLINQHPTVYEVVTGRVSRNKLFKKKPAVVSQRAGPGSAAAALQQPHLQPQPPAGYAPAQPMMQQPLQPFVHPGSKQVGAAHQLSGSLGSVSQCYALWPSGIKSLVGWCLFEWADEGCGAGQVNKATRVWAGLWIGNSRGSSSSSLGRAACGGCFVEA